MKNSVTFSLRINDEIHEKLIEEANKEQRSINNLIIKILTDYFNKKNNAN